MINETFFPFLFLAFFVRSFNPIQCNKHMKYILFREYLRFDGSFALLPSNGGMRSAGAFRRCLRRIGIASSRDAGQLPGARGAVVHHVNHVSNSLLHHQPPKYFIVSGPIPINASF